MRNTDQLNEMNEATFHVVQEFLATIWATEVDPGLIGRLLRMVVTTVLPPISFAAKIH